MKTILLPDVLKSTIRGSDDLESVRIVWEDSGSASRPPRETLLAKGGPVFAQQAKRLDRGELVIEVVTKVPKGVGKRAYSWRLVKEACVPVMHLIDWQRSNPYSIPEICSNYGVEASRRTIVKRLSLATKNMGKPVHQQHLTLVADTMTYSGEILGVSAAGYREFCRAVSISTPFTEASFQHPRKVFIEAAVGGISESIAGGVLTAAVWGRRIPVGTGMAASVISEDSTNEERRSRPIDPNNRSSFKLYRIPHVNQPKSNEKPSPSNKRPLEKAARVKAAKSLKKSNVDVPSANLDVPSTDADAAILKMNEPRRVPRSAQQSDKSIAERLVPSKGNGTKADPAVGGTKAGLGLSENCNSPPDASKDSPEDERDTAMHSKLRFLLQKRYKAGDRVNKIDKRMLLEEVLAHHPRRLEKIGCGVDHIVVDYHLEHPTTKCFHIVRTDRSRADFSYRKCLENKGLKLAGKKHT